MSQVPHGTWELVIDPKPQLWVPRGRLGSGPLLSDPSFCCLKALPEMPPFRVQKEIRKELSASGYELPRTVAVPSGFKPKSKLATALQGGKHRTRSPDVSSSGQLKRWRVWLKIVSLRFRMFKQDNGYPQRKDISKSQGGSIILRNKDDPIPKWVHHIPSF